VPITFQALFAPSSLALKFAIKTLLGGGLALWLAMRWGLEQPSWALMTAFIVAQPLSGMVVQKGLARLAGTLVGTVMSVLFIGLFAQTPGLFLLTLALWLALCTAASTQLRSAWAYAFVLAGYTAAIIALPAIDHPLQVFDQAVARCTEICLGIFCATASSALLWPMRVEQQLGGQARQAWQNGLQAASAMLGGEDEARKGASPVRCAVSGGNWMSGRLSTWRPGCTKCAHCWANPTSPACCCCANVSGMPPTTSRSVRRSTSAWRAWPCCWITPWLPARRWRMWRRAGRPRMCPKAWLRTATGHWPCCLVRVVRWPFWL